MLKKYYFYTGTYAIDGRTDTGDFNGTCDTYKLIVSPLEVRDKLISDLVERIAAKVYCDATEVKVSLNKLERIR